MHMIALRPWYLWGGDGQAILKAYIEGAGRWCACSGMVVFFVCFYYSSITICFLALIFDLLNKKGLETLSLGKQEVSKNNMKQYGFGMVWWFYR